MAMIPFQVIVFDRGDKEGKGAEVVANETVIAEGEQAAVLVAAWLIPADKQKPELAPRYKISVNRLQPDF
jgi:hypothetical protein